jgi:bacterioferritin
LIFFSPPGYNEWAIECSKNADSATKKIFEMLVNDEECHYNKYDKETDNLTKFGDNYLALQCIERSKTPGSGKPVAE